MGELIDYSEPLLREEFAGLPDGTLARGGDHRQRPGCRPDEPLAVRMTLTIEGDRATHRLPRSRAQAKGAINAPRA